MKRITAPSCCASELFDECVNEISDPDVRKRFVDQKPKVIQEYAKYLAHSTSKNWCNLPKAKYAKPKQTIIGDLTKEEFVKLYTTGMVASKGLARTRYDEIKLLACEECPYCGGCGEIINDEKIGTLDHFLPKARFPAFSIFPSNIVPSCMGCNGRMGSNFSTKPQHQPLHPYFDDAHFFDEKWTIASVSHVIPVAVSFDVNAPSKWTKIDKERVIKHFSVCGLGGRYRVKAGSDLSVLVDLRKSVHRNLTSDQFRNILIGVADNKNLPINGWKRTLHHCLSQSDWFCSYAF